MIVVFPMLTDESISQNAIPGICKALEKFILIYELDSIAKITGIKIIETAGKIVGSIASTAATAALMSKTKKEGLELTESHARPQLAPYNKNESEEDRDERYEKSMGRWEKEMKGDALQRQAQKDYTDRARSSVQNIFNTMKGIKDLGTISVDMPQDKTLSVEPTYMTVNTNTGTKIIGVKVIPCQIKSKGGYTLSELLSADASLDFFDTQFFRIYRKIIRAFWALCRGLRIPFLKDRVVTGDPVKDILWASTFHKRFIFCLLNYSDVSDSNLLKDAGGMHKLHQVGWNSLIFADDINKRVIFCMKEFHGLCSSTPYQFVYSSIGGDQSKIYTSLEDVKKSASPFFKLSVNSKKVYGESNNLKNYLNRIS
jgi:hypothetical protein